MFFSPRALLLSLLLAAPAAAAPTTPDWLRDGQKAFDTLIAGQVADFRAMDQAFIDAQAEAPDDVALAIAHCDLFWHVWDIEGLEWPGEASERHGECLESLEARMPDAPEVQVLLAERDSSEARERAALALWDQSADWPAPLRARLGKVLSEADHLDTDTARFSVVAAQLGDASALPEAITHVAAQEGADAAIALAAAAPLANNRWQLDARLESLAALDHPTAARDHLLRHVGTGVTPSWSTAVDILVEAGDLSVLDALLRDTKDSKDSTREARLALAVARGDRDAAVAHFKFDMEAFDRSGREYFSILSMDRLLAFSPRLLPFSFMLVLVSLFLLVIPLPLLAPVHYRGLARRVAGRAPEPVLPGLGLRHAWYGLAVCLLLLPTLVLGLAQPNLMGELFSGDEASAQTLTAMLWSSAAALLALLPTLYWLRRPQWTLPLSEWRGMLARVLGAYVLAFLVSLACVTVQGWLSSTDINVETSTFQTSLLAEGMARYGFVVTLLAVGVLVPLVEEWIFRGLLLGGLAKHVHFAWANLAQATLFMLIHDDVMRFPFYLAIGLLAGWLVKRYRSLLPALMLHMLNNLVAVWLMAS